MAFDLLERSIFGGSPIELYHFFLLGDNWRYTTEDRAVTFNSATFEPVADLSRSSVRVTQSIERGEIQVKARASIPLAQQYLVAPPSEPVGLFIYRKHRGDTDYSVRWTGRVQSCEWVQNGAWVIFRCTPVNWSLKQPGLRRSYQYSCPYALYGAGCNIDRNAHEVTASVVSVSGLLVTLTLPSPVADGHFGGGYALWETITGRQDTRMITSSVGTTITLQNTSIGLSPGDTIKLYPGCDHTPMTCHTKFNNADRYGGQPFIPTTNPFAGVTIY